MDTGEASEVDPAGVAADLDRLTRRLRTLSAGGWRSRRAAVDEVLADVVALNCTLKPGSCRRRPDLPDYALADAISVIAYDCIDCLRDRPDPTALAELRRVVALGLNGTR